MRVVSCFRLLRTSCYEHSYRFLCEWEDIEKGGEEAEIGFCISLFSEHFRKKNMSKPRGHWVESETCTYKQVIWEIIPEAGVGDQCEIGKKVKSV